MTGPFTLSSAWYTHSRSDLSVALGAVADARCVVCGTTKGLEPLSTDVLPYVYACSAHLQKLLPSPQEELADEQWLTPSEITEMMKRRRRKNNLPSYTLG